MADRRGRRLMLGLLAMLATGVFVGCDQPAMALHGADGDEPPAAADEQQPTQAHEPADRSTHLPSVAPDQAPNDQKPHEVPPSSDQMHQPGADEADHPQDMQGDEEESNTGETDTEDGKQESDDDEHDDKWRIPTRGSGGESPPDYIAPSDPKTV